MSSLEIPHWVGPVVTPILLILFIMILCFYYCYWKPRKNRNVKNKCSLKHDSEITPRPCQVQYVDDYATDYSFGSLYTDICPLPVSNGLAYCRPKDFQPQKVFYYPKYPERCLKSCKTECHGDFVNAKIKRSKVKCAKGHCVKYPELPIIIEGDSVVEEEEENENSKFLESDQEECNCNVQCPVIARNTQAVVVIECESSSDVSNGSNTTTVGHDSGYEG